MGIAWLWHFTDSTNHDALTVANEQRAFTVYSHWRATLRWANTQRDELRRIRLERAGRRELLTLSDQLLQDVGLVRIGKEIELSIPFPASRPTRLAWPMSSTVPASRCVVVVGSLGAGATLSGEAFDESSRAA